jgi:DNA-binding NarL/FixJ family response regulator
MNMKTALLPRSERLDDSSVDLLTGRQNQILNLVLIGHTNREIATKLQISVRTVEVHRFNLMRKLNVRNVAQLLRQALHLGLLPPTSCILDDDCGIGIVVR